jgi:hypothetical protein
MRIRIRYIVITLLLLSLGGVAPAVEKKPKSAPPTQQPKTPAVKPKDSQGIKPKAQPAPQKKFDDFIDRNKNGVDDRKEKSTK